MSRSFLRVVVLMALVGAACSATGESEPALVVERPNLILIVTDDLRTEEIEYAFGRSLPEWDSALERELLARGTTFPNYINTTPLCCPSRASILDGTYGHNHGVFGNRYDPSGGNGGWRRFWEQGLEEHTIGALLQEAGYRTAMVGKWLNGYLLDEGLVVPDTYVPAGWDEWYGTVINAGTISYYDFEMVENGTRVRYGADEPAYLTDVERDHGVRFIRDAAGGDEPFFLYLSAFSPHGPIEAAPRHLGMHAGIEAAYVPSYDEEDRSDKPGYVRALDADRIQETRYDMTLALDELIDAVFAALAESGAAETTYVFFVSDNGLLLGEHGITGKSAPYEESIRVPMIVLGPGVAPGMSRGHLAANIDIVPTLLTLAGQEVPAWVDGESLLAPMLGDVEPEMWRDAVLIELLAQVDSANVANEAIVPEYAGVRTLRYTYVEYVTGERELYDLAADPYQLENLVAGASSDLVTELSNLISVLRHCSGTACAAAARIDEQDSPGITHSCRWDVCTFEVPGTAGSITWDFGDGETATGASVEHRYSSPGRYEVSATFAGDSDPAAAAWVGVRVPDAEVYPRGVVILPRVDRSAANGRVELVDGTFAPVEGAEVVMEWTVDGEPVATDSAVTNDKGRAVTTLSRLEAGQTVEMCVVSATAPGLDYSPRPHDPQCASIVYP